MQFVDPCYWRTGWRTPGGGVTKGDTRVARRTVAPAGEESEMPIADVDPSDYVAVVVPGGRAPEYLRNDPDVRRILKHFFDAGAPVAALCHGPLMLAAAGVLNGRRSSAYPALAVDVETAGATFVDAPDVVDGNLVTGRAWPDHPQWFRAFMAQLRTAAPV